MTNFPNSPSVGDQVTFSNATYEWDGSRWKSLGTIAVGPTGPTGATGSAGSGGGGVSAGAGMTLAGSTLGIDPTAIVHVAGISADGEITAGGDLTAGGSIIIPNGQYIYNNQSSSIRPSIRLATSEITFSSKGSGTPGRLIVNNSEVKTWFVPFVSEQLINAQAGISMDAAGITFPDGTYQASAASGSTITAGAGMTLVGSTLGIDSTAIVHVAGISSDGGITAGGDLKYSGTLNAVSTIRIQQNGGNRLTFQDATLATLSTTRFHIPYATEVLSVNALYHLAGISMSGGITFADGTHQATAASGSGSSEFTSSHTMLLEFPDNKDYYLDSYTVADRTYNRFFGKSVTGGCSADLRTSLGVTLGSIYVNNTGVGVTFNTGVTMGTEVFITIRGVTSGTFTEDVRFVAGYTQ